MDGFSNESRKKRSIYDYAGIVLIVLGVIMIVVGGSFSLQSIKFAPSGYERQMLIAAITSGIPTGGTLIGLGLLLKLLDEINGNIKDCRLQK